MSITAPMNIETQSIPADDIAVFDDVQVLEDAAPAVAPEAVTTTAVDPLVPFLMIGVISWIAILVTAILLAF